ncbi:peptide-methionine (S)-S-oxide reductase MsrA [Lacticaseibacillus brantae]|uniref:Peptide methionine sulfoxide reductase MsrA n=1 Tax=Lacticaseibacillus brantae DSM 23927 TaxID=1423727 RepID=A0A0R2B681_9LACO|nr:peptide-methionine (S)-S-oxide reductase MsrA [Lacticaseibacillus brantae]KRM71785.1 peptide methionine sulfoxide reductase [Lacticaseibacillus brantae DSM 23927]
MVAQEELMTIMYNLILNPATRDWEREQITAAKNAVGQGESFNSQLAILEGKLRPLALRNNLTPDVADFYALVVGDAKEADTFDLQRHYDADAPYESRAVFAGGCFWCMVEPFEQRPGISAVFSGYTGGSIDHPTYDQVLGQYTGHVEAVEIVFDTRVVSYQDLLDLYWQITDPTDDMGQINDRGDQYRPVIFYRDETQHQQAEASKAQLADSGMYRKPIVTAIEPATTFWPAENYHQQFYKKNPRRYKLLERSRKEYLGLQHFGGRVRLGLKRLRGTAR